MILSNPEKLSAKLIFKVLNSNHSLPLLIDALSTLFAPFHDMRLNLAFMSVKPRPGLI